MVGIADSKFGKVGNVESVDDGEAEAVLGSDWSQCDTRRGRTFRKRVVRLDQAPCLLRSSRPESVAIVRAQVC